MAKPAIEIKNLGKTFRIYPDLVHSRIKQFLMPWRTYYKTKIALENINLTINRGEIVGVLGPNGAGKTTLLKIIAGISYPTTGEVVCHGRVTAILALGLGFNIRLTGAENLELGGMLLGMSKKEIKDRRDWIIDFAELGPYIDQPLTTYSSGMRARLSFAIAACQEPEILIIDEALATGDIRFVQKCINRIHEITSSGTTALFVSHNIWSIKKLTERCILINDGKVVDDGESHWVTDRFYEVMLTNEVLERTTQEYDYVQFVGTGEVRLTKIQLLDAEGHPTTVVNAGLPATVVVELEASRDMLIDLSLTCWRTDGVMATASSGVLGGNLNQDYQFTDNQFQVKQGHNTIVVEYNPLLLAPGDFYCDLHIFDSLNHSGYTSDQQVYFKAHILAFKVCKLKNLSPSMVFYQPANIYLR